MEENEVEKMTRHQDQPEKRSDRPFGGTEEHHCPTCGKDASDPALKCFGHYFCSEAHVTEYAREVRARLGKEQAAVAVEAAVEQDGTEPGAAKQGGLSRLLKLGACCAAPILALVILLPLLQGGATGLAAIGGNLLYFAALLACPLGMYLMMRSMQRMPQQEKGDGPEKSGDPKALPPDPGKP
jgi:hypothetical protein